MNETETDAAVKKYWSLPKDVERLKYLKTLSNPILSRMGEQDELIYKDAEAIMATPEGVAYREEVASKR